MTRLYLIRHAEPDFPGGVRRCLGRTDLPLGELGRLRAALLALELEGKARRVYTSPLRRAAETAAALSPSPHVLDGLAERDAGEWDGLSFEEIRSRWPELWARRGEDKSLLMPGAESDSAVLARFAPAIDAIRGAGGVSAAVSHAGAIGAYLASLGLGEARVPYGSYTVLVWEGGRAAVEALGVQPRPEPDERACLALLRAAGNPEGVIAHCAAVSALAGDIAARLGMDEALLRAAGYLHDIARLLPRHPQTGADWLEALGYGDIAALIRPHHDHEGGELDEAAVLFIADKLLLGDTRCTIAERFAASADKCKTPGQRAAHERRYRAARRISGLLEERGIEL